MQLIGMPQCQNASYCSSERSAIHLNSMAFLNKQTISLSMDCDDFRQSFAQQFVVVVVVVVNDLGIQWWFYNLLRSWQSDWSRDPCCCCPCALVCLCSPRSNCCCCPFNVHPFSIIFDAHLQDGQMQFVYVEEGAIVVDVVLLFFICRKGYICSSIFCCCCRCVVIVDFVHPFSCSSAGKGWVFVVVHIYLLLLLILPSFASLHSGYSAAGRADAVWVVCDSQCDAVCVI